MKRFVYPLVAAIWALTVLPGYSDIVKLNTGEELDGKITYESSDFIKIEIQLNAGIKDTKTVLRKDIAEIQKSTPDDLEFERIQSHIPTPSLMSSSDYEEMIRTGPEAFLKAYPDSPHKDEVEKILKQLQEEKALRDAGQVKLEDQWISKDYQQNFKANYQARVLKYRMNQLANKRDFTSAMREFERIEEQYTGTEAYPEAVKLAQMILPVYGKTIQRNLADLEYKESEYQKGLETLNELQRADTEAAYQREQEQYKARVEAEKAEGIKWMTVNVRSRDSLESVSSLIESENERLASADPGLLAEQAKVFMTAEEMINKGQTAEAEAKLKEALAMPTSVSASPGARSSSGPQNRPQSRTGTGSSAKRSSSGKGSSSKENYVASLYDKLKAKKAEVAEAAKKAKEAEDSKTEELMTALQGSAAKDPAEEEKKEEGAGEAPATSLAAAMAASKASDDEKKKETGKPEKKSTSSAKKPAKPAPASDEADEEEEEQPRPTSASSSGGGFNLQYVIWGLAAVLIIVTVGAKVLGIGGKKEDA